MFTLQTHKKYETAIVKKNMPQMSNQEVEEIIKDKENIEITKELNVIIDAGTEIKVKITIKNNGNVKQVLKECTFSKSIFEMENETHNLNPGDEVIFVINCKSRFVGVNYELIVFNFENFKVGRLVRIEVKSLNLDKNVTTNPLNQIYNKSYKRIVANQREEDSLYFKGIKPYTPARFIKNRPVIWEVPEVLWNIIYTILTENITGDSAKFFLTERIPVLGQTLNFVNYNTRFKNLLF